MTNTEPGWDSNIVPWMIKTMCGLGVTPRLSLTTAQNMCYHPIKSLHWHRSWSLCSKAHGYVPSGTDHLTQLLADVFRGDVGHQPGFSGVRQFSHNAIKNCNLSLDLDQAAGSSSRNRRPGGSRFVHRSWSRAHLTRGNMTATSQPKTHCKSL